MQGILQRALEQCRELAPVGGPSGLARKVLEQPASVVGLAKKRAVDSLGRPAHGVPCSERHEDAKRRASQPAQRACRHDCGWFDPEDAGDVHAKTNVSATPMTLPTTTIAWRTTR